jgi:hypothetical protein
MNTDGHLDVVIGGRWYETRSHDGSLTWTEHVYTDWSHEDTYSKVADINRDGRPDIVLTPSEGTFRMAWFEAPLDGKTERWIEHVVQKPMTFTHSLEIADMDGDGDLDIVTAEMAQSQDPDEVMVFINEENGRSWSKQVVDTTGSHNLRLGDIDNDGDLDLYGSNWQDPPVGKVEFWRNLKR